MKKLYKIILIVLFLSTSTTAYCQEIELSKYQLPFAKNGIELFKLDADSLFEDHQKIVLLSIDKNVVGQFKFRIAYSESLLKRTSVFGLEGNAIAALNGSFFNVEKGGSVAYLESEGKVIAKNHGSREKWGKPDSLLNGAIVLTNKGTILLEKSKPAAFYEKSNKESAVLVSGPLLLLKKKRVPLEHSSFVTKKHPRTCLCETARSILFIAIDGRSEVASGMNLKEVQEFLLRLKCRNAINLDGGGSTTLWVNDGILKGIQNHPSDKEGERPVANAILIE